MLKIPLNDIISRIKTATNLSEQQINQKIEDKLKQLSGLISKEGAAHIIANELGVKLFEQAQGRLQIKNILAGMRNVETLGKIQKLYELREFQTETRSGKVASMIIGDETGSIRIVLWGAQADNLKRLKEGDIVRIESGYVRENQGIKEIHLNDRSTITINPEGEKIDNVKQFTSERKTIKDLQEGMENIELLGTIVQVFDPRFFEVCPNCGKRTKPDGDKFACNEHGFITPDYSYVLNLFLDDGSENIRCVFFRNQAERLLQKSHDDILKYKDIPQDFEKIKTDLLGNQIKLIGRVTKNQMFDRLEFTTQLVFLNPNPEEEIKKLEAEKNAG
jgi:replication factor A1